MRITYSLLVLLASLLGGCTTIQRTAHLYSDTAPPGHVFQYKDGGASTYYAFRTGDAAQADTLIFFYGATGCPSWKSVMPGYVDGLTANALVFVLNKRFVADRSTGLFECGHDFHLANNPAQWVADYSEFIATQRRAMATQPRHIVLVGVSEGALPAIRIAAHLPEITHLAIIGSGGYSMRQSLSTLKEKGAIRFDVSAGWERIASEPRSIEKSWYGNRYRWWSDIMDMDPINDFLSLNMPVLLGIGEEDQSVPVESVRYLEAKFKEAGKTNLTVQIYPGADHRLNARDKSYRRDFFTTLSQSLR